ncbi:unnamed protein product [Alternaria alternata]
MNVIRKTSQLLAIFLGSIGQSPVPLSRRTFTKECMGEINKELLADALTLLNDARRVYVVPEIDHETSSKATL